MMHISISLDILKISITLMEETKKTKLEKNVIESDECAPRMCENAKEHKTFAVLEADTEEITNIVNVMNRLFPKVKIYITASAPTDHAIDKSLIGRDMQTGSVDINNSTTSYVDEMESRISTISETIYKQFNETMKQLVNSTDSCIGSSSLPDSSVSSKSSQLKRSLFQTKKVKDYLKNRYFEDEMRMINRKEVFTCNKSRSADIDYKALEIRDTLTAGYTGNKLGNLNPKSQSFESTLRNLDDPFNIGYKSGFPPINKPKLERVPNIEIDDFQLQADANSFNPKYCPNNLRYPFQNSFPFAIPANAILNNETEENFPVKSNQCLTATSNLENSSLEVLSNDSSKCVTSLLTSPNPYALMNLKLPTSISPPSGRLNEQAFLPDYHAVIGNNTILENLMSQRYFIAHKQLSVKSEDDFNSSAGENKDMKTFPCYICKRKFTRSDMLNRHLRLHSGIKPYHCNICSQTFSRSDHLNTHQRTHTGEKPYTCPQCPYAACRRDMITRHMKVHNKQAEQKVSKENNQNVSNV